MKEPQIKKRLGRLLEEAASYNDKDRRMALQQIVELDREAVIATLSLLMDDSADTDTKCRAAEMVFRLMEHDGLALILPHLDSIDATLRWHICEMLSYYGNEQAVLPLTKVLRDDEEADVRISAALALGAIGEKAALEALNHAAQNDQGEGSQGHKVSETATDVIQQIERRDFKQ